MCKRKCRLERRELTLIHETEEFIELNFKGLIVLPDGRRFTLHSNNDIRGINFLTSTFSVSLDCNDGRELDVLYSEFYATHAQMRLKSIRVPDELRNQGLGKCILEAWLRLLPTYAILHNIHFSTIEGDVISGGDFTPKFAKNLYMHFDGFEYTAGKKLVLDKKALEIQNKLKYTIESINQ